MRKKGMNMEKIKRCMRIVNIDNIVESEGGWNVKKEWKEVMSGGEKQRMAMDRILYKRKNFEMLDE
jgi:ATP-binding cassette subfamily D (ALD) long-chain fatty acid import protein